MGWSAATTNGKSGHGRWARGVNSRKDPRQSHAVSWAKHSTPVAGGAAAVSAVDGADGPPNDCLCRVHNLPGNFRDVVDYRLTHTSNRVRNLELKVRGVLIARKVGGDTRRPNKVERKRTVELLVNTLFVLQKGGLEVLLLGVSVLQGRFELCGMVPLLLETLFGRTQLVDQLLHLAVVRGGRGGGGGGTVAPGPGSGSGSR